MAKIQAFSSVSVVDLTDVGSINLYCTSNQPLSVIYDPNSGTNGSYTPNWANSNLKITPVISYNGSSLGLTAQGVSITFTRKEGSGNATALTTGETVSGGVLTVNANKLSGVTSGQLTYICKLTYTDPNTGVPLTTEASITYTLVTQATQIKDVDIIGETAFLYNADRTVVGTGTITLKAALSNVNMAQWQYQKSDGTYAAYPVTAKYNANNTSTELVVGADEANIWLQGDRYAVIRVTTSDSTVYDTVQINKILDGVAGDAVVSAILTNENFLLPVNPNGTPKSNSVWSAGATTIKIFEGGEDVTSSWSITADKSTGLSGTYNATTHTFTPSGLTADVGYVNFTCKKSNYDDIIKRYTITKQYAGADGDDAVIYSIEPSDYVLNWKRDANNGLVNLTPSSVTFNAYVKTGGDLTKTGYAGRFKIYETTDGTEYTIVNSATSSTDETSKTYTPSSNLVLGIRAVLFAAGGFDKELDDQTVAITQDGATGATGQNGNNGITMYLSNYSDVIPCTTAKKATAQKDISIPFSAYQGITRVPVVATVGTLPTGVTVQSNTAGTATSAGLLVLRVAKDATFMSDVNILTGDITITLTATIIDANTGASSTTSTDQKYTWTKNVQASNGTSAVILQLYSEDGGTVSTTKPATTIKTLLASGTTTVTPSAVTWAKFSGTGYTTIDGETGTSITINADDVEDQMWLRCQATYSSKTYTAYYTIDDVTDPYTAYTFATVEQFKNSQGFGAIYTRVYQNGVEVDPIKSTVFSDTAPIGASNGDFYYYLDKSKKTCTLKKYNGTSWADATEKDTLTYKYYRLDNSGNAIDTTSAFKDTRCFYVDPSMINGRMQFICDVTG
jgi:hypothetical protein